MVNHCLTPETGAIAGSAEFGFRVTISADRWPLSWPGCPSGCAAPPWTAAGHWDADESPTDDTGQCSRARNGALV